MNTKTISSVFILAVLFALLAIVSAEFYLNEDYILDDEFDEGMTLCGYMHTIYTIYNLTHYLTSLNCRHFLC